MNKRLSTSLANLLLALLLLPSFCLAKPQLIIEPDMGRAPLLTAIRSTQHSINLIMYGMTDQALLNALIDKKHQGKTIKVLLEQTPYHANSENQKAIAQLQKNHISWQGNVPPYQYLHQKTLVLDQQKAIVMTFNLTHSTFKNERNFALILDDPATVHAIQTHFIADWNHVPTSISSDQLLYSPDNSREALTKLIKHTKKSLQLYAQSVSDYAMVGELAKLARQGKTVQILTSKKLRKKQEAFLLHAGVHIRYHKKYLIHAKVFIIDNTKAIIGSLNLTKTSLDRNRELSVLSQDQKIIQQLQQVFAKDWRSANQGEWQQWIHNHINKRNIKRLGKMLNAYIEQ